MKTFYYLSLLLIFSIHCACEGPVQEPDGPADGQVSIAFMADVHFHDVFGDFREGRFEGLPVNRNGETQYATIRTMQAQLTSTRLFNENYFAFLAALDDAVERGIRHIALAGDFTDDGQPVHLRGFTDILEQYRQQHNLRFYIAPGNHDPNRPYTQPAGKRDYLGRSGRPQPVFSTDHPACLESTGPDRPEPGEPDPHPVVCTDEVVEYGYEDLLGEIGVYGIQPNPAMLYFETPFSSWTTDDYRYEEAANESGYGDRQYEVCHEGSGGPYRQHYTNCFSVMDMSYLAEPEEGIWLMGIDANVYIPRENADPDAKANPANFHGAGNAGYNAVVTHKKHLVDWIRDVAERADQQGKTLIAFSHYPAVDFYNRAGQQIEALWGEGRFQLSRVPEATTSRILAETGLQLHVGGHMHMNDTDLYRDDATGNTLFNVQSTSLAAYVPSYKILQLEPGKPVVEVETAIIDEAPGFDTFFSLYEQEWTYLDSIGYEGIWDLQILKTDNYYEYNDWHMRELSRLRFLPREWPEDIRLLLPLVSGRDLLTLSILETDMLYDEVMELIRQSSDESVDTILSEYIPDAWQLADEVTDKLLEGIELNGGEVSSIWDGTDLSIDFYRLRNAGSLAFRDIPEQRLEQYAFLEKHFSSFNLDIVSYDENRFNRKFRFRFGNLFQALQRFSSGLPDDHFSIHLDNGQINSLSHISNPFTKLKIQ